MHLDGKVCGFITAIPHSQTCKHISFCCYANTGSSSLIRFLPYITPEVFLNMFYFINLRISVYLCYDYIDLLKFKINNIIHHALCQSYMLFIQFKVKFGFISKWIIDITVEIYCQKTATVVGTKWNLPAWIGRGCCVSQNNTPGSADFQALCIILFQSCTASISFANFGLSELIGYCCLKSVFSSTAFIKSSVSFTETLAPVTFPLSSFASINFPESGCLIEMESINAPRLPS